MYIGGGLVTLVIIVLVVVFWFACFCIVYNAEMGFWMPKHCVGRGNRPYRGTVSSRK